MLFWNPVFFVFSFRVLIAFLLLSINVTCLAPWLNASNPTDPLPPKRSKKVLSWILFLIVSKSAVLTLSRIGLVESPGTEDNFTKAENIYKLPDEVIETVDKINADYDAGLSESRKVALPEELAVYARLYDGTLPLLYGRMPDTDAAGRVYAFMNYVSTIRTTKIYFFITIFCIKICFFFIGKPRCNFWICSCNIIISC